MNEQSEHHKDEQTLRAPLKIESAFRELRGEQIFVPPRVDCAVLEAARRHLSGREERPAFWFRRWLFWPGIATACALLGWLTHHAVRPFAPSTAPGAFALEDINRDGRVDILDAFALARQVRLGSEHEVTLDFNGDGVVDERDAEWLAARAVVLEKGGAS